MIFHTKGKKINMENKTIIFDDNEPGFPHDPSLASNLERVHSNHQDKDTRSYKLLGILLDENLNFDQQTTALHAKLKKSIFVVNKVKHFLPQKALKTLYHSLIHSHLNYCPSIYSCTSKSNLDKLFILQKKAIRIITNSPYHAHTEPLFTKLNILPLAKIITSSNLSLMHSTHFSYAPISTRNLWPRNEARNIGIQLRNSNNYSLPKCNYSFFSKFPAYTLPLLWNTYPGTSILQPNKTTFLTSLKNELLNTPPPTPDILPPLPTLTFHSLPHPSSPSCRSISTQKMFLKS